MAINNVLNRMGFGPGAENDTGRGQAMILASVLSISLLVGLALLLIWLNIERTKLAYDARALQGEVEHARELSAKLGVEREHLLSPGRLESKAEQLGLRPAKPGQIRRME